jgi:ATP-dependent Clp protease ATP-binding subunit ClpC
VIERFSVHCREALTAAEREARSLKHAQIATEHLLLGLLRIEESVAAQALRLTGVNHRKARRHILRLVDVGPARVEGLVTFTPRVKEILEDAFTGAVWTQRLGQCMVDPAFRASQPIGRPWVEVRTEQVLLALVAHGDGVAAHVLAELGVDLEKAAVTTTHIRFPQLERLREVFAPAVLWPPKPA